jgi:hypothetical protein
MRRARRFVLAGVVALAAVWAPSARAAQIFVEAPEACLDPAALADEVSELVGKPLAAVADVDFRVGIAERPAHRWRLRIETLASPNGTGGTAAVRRSREIEGATCAELAEAAAVAIAVSVRSIDGGTTPGPEAPPAPPPGPAAPLPPSVSRPAPPGPSGIAPPGPSWRPAMAMAFAADSGALPHTGLGVDVEGSLQRGALRLTAFVTGFGSDDARGPMNAGGSFQLVLGGALACFGPHLGRWTPLGCGGFELGRLEGTGLGVAHPETGDALWRAARGDLGVSAAVGGNAAFLVRAGLVVPLARPEFVLDDSQLVYRPSRLSARLTAGLELGF